MPQATEIIDNHNSVIKSTASTLASMGFDKLGNSTASKLIAPAVWAVDYAVNEKRPDELDISLYVLGLLAWPAAVAATVTGLMKSAVDDNTAMKLRQTRAAEGAPYSDFIFACSSYSLHAPNITAQKIAALGGTAWRHSNGLWVFIVDAEENFVMDYIPKQWEVIYQPKYPLEENAYGKLRWDIKTKW